MGNKIQPNLHRLGVTQGWTSRWFGLKEDMVKNLEEDTKIRDHLTKKLPRSGVSKIEIERHPRLINVIIYTSKAGMIIGRGGSGVDALKADVKRIMGASVEVRVTVEEIKKPQEDAHIVSQNIAEQLEKRIPFRRVLKQTAENVFESHQVKGVKITLSGRLDGAEMSRVEYVTKGKIPLSTLRSNIEYSQKVAYTKYGTVGVKVWIYKGDTLK